MSDGAHTMMSDTDVIQLLLADDHSAKALLHVSNKLHQVSDPIASAQWSASSYITHVPNTAPCNVIQGTCSHSVRLSAGCGPTDLAVVPSPFLASIVTTAGVPGTALAMAFGPTPLANSRGQDK